MRYRINSFKKKLTLCILTSLLFSIFLVKMDYNIFAEELLSTKETLTEINVESYEMQENTIDNINDNNYDDVIQLENVTMEQISSKINNKLMEIVKAIQKIALPLCALFFIISALSGMMGIGNKNGFYGSLRGMLFAGLAFIGILKAEIIISFFYTWFSK